LGIWRNIGKIVSLSCEIILLEVEWYLFGVHKKKKHESHDSPKSKVNNIHLSEEEESLERSKLMVELCEQPHLPTNDNELDW
tara:strand:+ start:53 stop:298 length:246 start_codon:yes stop_codon:yes gene_type:complete